MKPLLQTPLSPGRFRLLALFLLATLSSNIHAQKEWYFRSSTQFISPAGISVVDSFYIYVTDRQGLHKSTDGGYTWRRLLTTPFYGGQVKFTSRTDGILVESGKIRITTDGGENWQPVANAGSDAKMVFLDSVNGITFRTGSESSGFKISFGKTSDRGATWQYTQTLLHPGVLFWIDQIDSTIWGFGSILSSGNPAPVLGTLIAHSTNNGATWITDSSYYNYTNWTGMVAMRPNSVTGVVSNRLFKISTDGGENFAHYTHPRYFYSLKKSGDTVLYAGTDSGYIARSQDFGRSFTYTNLNTVATVTLLDVAPAGDLYAWADDNKLFSTIKLKPSPVGVEDDPGNVPASFSLSQNYPNPFNPETVIRYALPVAGYARGVVYDILGREVATLLNTEMPAGEHQLKFDASWLPSGVYIFRLEAGEHSSAIKMLVEK